MARLSTTVLVLFFALLLVTEILTVDAAGKKSGSKKGGKTGSKTGSKTGTKTGSKSGGKTGGKSGGKKSGVSSVSPTTSTTTGSRSAGLSSTSVLSAGEDGQSGGGFKASGAQWDNAKCPEQLWPYLRSACTVGNCTIGGIPARWKKRVVTGNKVDGTPSLNKYGAVAVGDSVTPTTCCNQCAGTPGCTYWQFDVNRDNNGHPQKGGACYLMQGKVDYTCGSMLYSTEEAKKYPIERQTRTGGECNPSATILNDPHLVGAQGTRFDFNGRPDKSFCLISDQKVNINMLLRGYYDTRTEGAALVVDGKAVHTWIKEVGIVWTADGVAHKVRLAARSGKQQERGTGFMKAIEVDGVELSRMQAGDEFTAPGGLTIAFRAYEKTGPYDVDYYTVSIGDLISLDVRLRVANPKLQTPSDAETHINMGVTKFDYTSDVHGVLGQTYRADHTQRAHDFQRLIATLHHPISADGKSGEGFLDGTPRMYETSTVMAPDCGFSKFHHV